MICISEAIRGTYHECRPAAFYDCKYYSKFCENHYGAAHQAGMALRMQLCTSGEPSAIQNKGTIEDCSTPRCFIAVLERCVCGLPELK